MTSPAAPSRALEPADVEYLEGRWTAPSLWHGDAVRRAATALDHHFRERSDVIVGMELRVYYERGNNKVWLRPDVQVVFGGERGNRGSYRVWEEGKAPDFVLEVASPSTAEHDAEYKARECAQIGVREYWRLDPLGTSISNPLEGYVTSGGSYGRVQPVEGVGLYLRSDVLAAGVGIAQPEAGRGDGSGVPRPDIGGGVRRRTSRIGAAQTGSGGESAGIGEATPKPRCS